MLLFCLATGTAFLVYAGGCKNEFVWDDPIVLGQQLHVFHTFGDIFFPPQHIPQFGQLYYRPLIILSYVFDRWMWGDTPFGFHFPVILFHALNSGLVFLVGRRLLGSLKGATLAALGGAILFATHPIHTESVYWMAGRSDTLAALLLLPALLAYLTWKHDRSRRLYLVLAALLFLIGCFAKESALGLLFVVAAADILGVGGKDPGAEHHGKRSTREPSSSGERARQDRPVDRREKGKKGSPARIAPDPSREGATISIRIGRSLPGWLALGIAAAVYFSMRSAALAKDHSSLTMQDPDLLASLANLLRAVGFYLVKVFAPVHLDAYIPEIPHPEWSLAAGILGLASAAALGLYAWKRGETLVAFFISWFFGALAPSLAIAFFQISEAPVAERYLYLPSVGFCLLAGYLAFSKLPSVLAEPARKRAPSFGGSVGGMDADHRPGWVRAMALTVAGASLLAVTVVYGWASAARGLVWRTDMDFWKDGVAKSPDEGLPHLHLGLAYANKNQDDLAEKEYNLALTTKYDAEGRSIVNNDLGMLYMGKNDEDKADFYFQQAIQIRREYPTPYYGLGLTAYRRAEMAGANGDREGKRRELEAAEQNLRQAINLNPRYVKALGMMGQILHVAGKDTEALPYLDRVLQLVSSGREFEVAAKLRNAIVHGKRSPSGTPQK